MNGILSDGNEKNKTKKQKTFFFFTANWNRFVFCTGQIPGQTQIGTDLKVSLIWGVSSGYQT